MINHLPGRTVRGAAAVPGSVPSSAAESEYSVPQQTAGRLVAGVGAAADGLPLGWDLGWLAEALGPSLAYLSLHHKK